MVEEELLADEAVEVMEVVVVEVFLLAIPVPPTHAFSTGQRRKIRSCTPARHMPGSRTRVARSLPGALQLRPSGHGRQFIPSR